MKGWIGLLGIAFFISAAWIISVGSGLTLINDHQKEQESKTSAKFLSPTKYEGPGGKYRWKAKIDESEPDKVVETTIEEMSLWDDLTGIHEDSLRQGNERKFFKLTGKVSLVKCEDDGDLHVQVTDPKAKELSVVCEVPVGKEWDAIRKEVFGWAKVKFPCKPHTLELTKYPTITVTGKAFWDGEHHSDKTPNRRSYDKNVLVWEIHPVMRIEYP